ncbi:diaminobutyrate--2-oxoglutarate transaminase [Pigmentiphaga sp.]|jgi:diaminobutyrate--2-oxoglutarate aminotransferase|uniref:diaminobutyrate--2-oxoglutarate transaminase n=1 Tax=Pigmentiphaga sp. TaxID=1977564 RepID=UPI0025D34C3B|nr:diaminobutyrate--2-oxoglutarate transaminase [Pigmentiphaga sp.]MBX6318736.1 diaminobutyrate--2-oxoglutarate transaminase [Pigmentiphaga sp.]
MDLKIFDRLESEVRGYIRSFPVVFSKARGALLFDEEGRQYIDLFAGAGTLNYGHNNPALKQPLLDYVQADGVVHGLDMATSAKKAFLEAFERLILQPRGMQYTLQFTGPTGTNAVEAALKLARRVKQRSNIVSFTHGFHGVTSGSLSATANAKYRDAAGVSLGNTTFVPYDGYFGPDVDTMAYFERMLEDRSSGMDAPAAVIVETVQGEGGVNVATLRWLRELQRLCRRYDMLLIVDDIQVGCGRTGTFFSFESAGIQPDIVTLSKSLSGFGLPMAMVLIKPELDVWKPGEHNGTFRGNNLAFITARQALEHYWRDDAFTREIQAKETLVRDWLENMVHNHPDADLSVRGRGLIQGLVSGVPGLANKIAAQAFKHGVVIETSGANDEVLKLLPPLTIEESLLKQALEVLDRAVAEVVAAERPGQKQSNARVLKFGGKAR